MPLALSSTSSPLAVAAELSPSPSPSPSLLLSLPLRLSPSSLTPLRRRCFVIVVSSCFFAANWRSWTKPLLPKLSTLVDCCLGRVAQHLQAFCMLLPPIAITSLSTHCCCRIAIVQLPSSNRCRRHHQHHLRRQQRRHHCCHCIRRHCRLIHRHCCCHRRRCFVNVALSSLSKWGGASFLGTYPTYSFVGYLARPLVVCGNTNAKFDNKPLMKKGQNKRGGIANMGGDVYTGGHQRMTATRSFCFLARQVVLNSIRYAQFSMGVLGAILRRISFQNCTVQK